MSEFHTVVQCLKYWTEKLGDAPAFIFRDKCHERYVLTWNKLYTLSGRFAAVLHDWGLTRGHLVANTLPNSPERVVCEAGILMSGAASVNTQCLLADGSDLLRTLSVSRASAVVVDPDVANSPWNALKGHVSLDDDGNGVTSESLPELRKVYFVRRVRDKSAENFLNRLETQRLWFEADDITSSDVMSVFTTSGTTGFSKLVPYSHKEYFNYNVTYMSFAGGNTLFNISPLGWLGGYFAFSLLNGSKRVLCDVRGGGLSVNMAEFIWRSTQEEQCTMAFLIPVFLPRLVEVASGSLHDAKTDAKRTGKGGPFVFDNSNRGKSISPRTGTDEVVKETDTSGLERDRGNEDESTQRRGLNPRTANTETAAAKRQGSADDTSNPSTSAARKLDYIAVGGFPVTKTMVQLALKLADTVVVVYATTDHGFVSLLEVQDGDDYVDHDCGHQLKSVEVKVVSQGDEDAEVLADQLGHILVRNQPAPTEYLNDPQTTAAAFTEDRYFRTGDMGRVDDRGHLIVEGRGGDAIMRGGYIFYPGWLEKCICACPGVESVLVVGVPDPDLHEELCACVVLGSDDLPMTQVRDFVEKCIVTKEDDPLSPRPRYYLRFESFPKTSTYKPNRKATRKMAAEMLGLTCSS